VASTPADEADADTTDGIGNDADEGVINVQNECLWKPLLIFTVVKQRGEANFLSARENMGTRREWGGLSSIAI
jgi:hypothetical protein